MFASDHQQLSGAVADTLLAAVDQFLANWTRARPVAAALWDATGATAAFLASWPWMSRRREGASGCSIDGLFRTLQELERSIGSKLVGGGRVFYRTRSGVEGASREEFAERIRTGEVARETPIFNTAVTTVADWRGRFEEPAGKAWTAQLF